jgi:hypothetical protein
MANGSADTLIGNQYLFGAQDRRVPYVGRMYLLITCSDFRSTNRGIAPPCALSNILAAAMLH